MLDFQRLEDIATQLAHEAASTDRKRGEAPRPLFDEQLFHCRSKLLVPCVNEIRDEIRASTGSTKRVNYTLAAPSMFVSVSCLRSRLYNVS